MIHPTPTPYAREITGSKAAYIRHALDAAVQEAIHHGLQDGGKGVLVTQHTYARYTVALTVEVPYGQIHEKREESVDPRAQLKARSDVLG